MTQMVRTSLRNLWMVLLSLPAHSIFGVFEDDAAVGELATNLIGAAEVATSSRFLPFVDQRLNFAVEHLALPFAEDVQHGVDAIDRFEQLALIVCFDFFTR